MPLYVPEISTTGSPQAMLPRFDENLFEVVSLGTMLTAIANAVSQVGGGVWPAYNGAVPGFTPNSTAALGIDQGTGKQWQWYNNAWH